MQSPRFKAYKKEFDYSYSLGLFPTVELVTHKQDMVKALVFSSDATKSDIAKRLQQLCRTQGIPVVTDDKQLASLSKNGNSVVAGIFSKWADELAKNDSHIVLVEPDDMGNIGTILRSMLGFGYQNLAIIGKSADYWHPRCVRASMGALFQQRVVQFETIEAYQQTYPQHTLYPFMLDGAQKLSAKRLTRPHSLVFGNEGAGLDARYKTLGEPIAIEQDSAIDSLNLATAVSIAMYAAYVQHQR